MPTMPVGDDDRVLKVIDQKNKREVLVRINARGSYAKDAIIDGSGGGAAGKLEMIDGGIVQVKLEVLDR